MKAKFLQALIIDQDPEQGKTFSQSIKSIFGKLFMENNPTQAAAEIRRIKPDVIFLNLTLSQRAANLEILEKVEFDADHPTIVFGLNDQVEEELLAHALESGVNDIFIRPFDEDLISTKINRYFISEKAQDRDLQYAKINPPIKAEVNFRFKLLNVDESGLTFKSEHSLSKGMQFRITNPLMLEIFEVPEVSFMVTKTWISDDLKDFFFYVEPKDASEQINAALRRFILRKI